jgi:hypothetical protein
VAPSLIRGAIEGVRIVWIDDDVGDARVLADVQNVLPGLAAVSCFEKTTLAARPPQRSLRSNVDDV